MISKKQRIPSSLLKTYLLKRADKRENEFFNLYYFNNNLNYCRFAIIILSKLSLKPVKRNKLKRQLKAILKSWEKEKGEGLGLDIIVIVKKYQNLDFTYLKKTMFSLLNTINK